MPPSVVSTPDITAATIAQTGTQAASSAAQTAATTAQTAQQAASWAAALGQKGAQDAIFNIENALQTAEMVLRNTQMIYEWDESRKDRNQWLLKLMFQKVKPQNLEQDIKFILQCSLLIHLHQVHNPILYHH